MTIECWWIVTPKAKTVWETPTGNSYEDLTIAKAEAVMHGLTRFIVRSTNLSWAEAAPQVEMLYKIITEGSCETLISVITDAHTLLKNDNVEV